MSSVLCDVVLRGEPRSAAWQVRPAAPLGRPALIRILATLLHGEQRYWGVRAPPRPFTSPLWLGGANDLMSTMFIFRVQFLQL